VGSVMAWRGGLVLTDKPGDRRRSRTDSHSNPASGVSSDQVRSAIAPARRARSHR
jgi:hypothetical protein